MEKIGLVTDSTCDLPLSYYEENDVLMVPLIVRFGEEIFKDWVDIKPDEFYRRLTEASELPKTSQPTVADFINAYDALKNQGFTHIISLHLSSKLSGTVGSAEAARGEVDIPIEVVDTKMISGGIALILQSLIEMRKNGSSFQEMVKRAYELSEKISTLGYLSTLKYLELGGRIGKAQALVGTLLDIKPLLTLEDGVVAPYKRVRGAKKVIPEIIRSFQSKVKDAKKVKIALSSAGDIEEAKKLRNELEKLNLPLEFVFSQIKIGSVIGTYTGPGALLFFWYVE
jgi:DegV family protein with EDD domain